MKRFMLHFVFILGHCQRMSGQLHLDQGSRTFDNVVRRVWSQRQRNFRQGPISCSLCLVLWRVRLDRQGQRWECRRCWWSCRSSHQPDPDRNGRYEPEKGTKFLARHTYSFYFKKLFSVIFSVYFCRMSSSLVRRTDQTSSIRPFFDLVVLTSWFTSPCPMMDPDTPFWKLLCAKLLLRRWD